MKFEKPLDLDHIHRARDRVARVGVELEGGWNREPEGLVHDGSVHVESLDRLYIGELPSPVLKVDEVGPWMQAHYPNHVNATCGMHVHLSFRTPLTYQKLMTPSYPATIVAYVTRWAKSENLELSHPLWARLLNRSEFCQHVFAADDQSRVLGKDYDRRRPGNRYSVVNYCYSAKGTLECRLLPMMQTPEQSIRAVQQVIRTTNAFLVATARPQSGGALRREEKVRARYVDTGDDLVREEKRIRV